MPFGTDLRRSKYSFLSYSVPSPVATLNSPDSQQDKKPQSEPPPFHASTNHHQCLHFRHLAHHGLFKYPAVSVCIDPYPWVHPRSLKPSFHLRRSPSKVDGYGETGGIPLLRAPSLASIWRPNKGTHTSHTSHFIHHSSPMTDTFLFAVCHSSYGLRFTRTRARRRCRLGFFLQY